MFTLFSNFIHDKLSYITSFRALFNRNTVESVTDRTVMFWQLSENDNIGLTMNCGAPSVNSVRGTVQITYVICNLVGRTATCEVFNIVSEA